jgi:hypothetical protein
MTAHLQLAMPLVQIIFVFDNQLGTSVEVFNADRLRPYHQQPEWVLEGSAENQIDTSAKPANNHQVMEEVECLKTDSMVEVSNIDFPTPEQVASRPRRIIRRPDRYRIIRVR